MKYVVYEVWTCSRIIDADDDADAYIKGEPDPPRHDMSLCNWHAVCIDAPPPPLPPSSGGLNYRQIPPNEE